MNPISNVTFECEGAFGRRVRITEKNSSGGKIEEHFYLWDGLEIIEKRDAGTGNALRRYYPLGMKIVSGSDAGDYFYTFDHLGSIREVIDGNAFVVARYDYDPYGRVTQTSGTFKSDFLFTGHFYHEKSGLHLAPYRAYDAELGRWLNRDPLGYAAGVNLYGYVLGDPINRWDPLGLDWLDAAADFTAGWGDTLSFGVTRGIRSGMDWFGGKVTDQWASDSAVVDRCSDAYGAGQLTGTVHGFALGGAGYARGISTFRSQGTRTKLYEIGQRTFSNRQHGYYTQRNANIVKKGIDIARAEGARGAALPGFGSAPYFTKTIWTGLTPLARQEFGRTVVPTAYGFGVGAYGTNSLYFGNSDCQ